MYAEPLVARVGLKVIHRWLVASALSALTWGVGVGCGRGVDQSQDVVETFFVARNARDERAVRAVLADDVIFRFPGGHEFRGSGDVARQVIQPRFMWEVGDVRTIGNTITWMESITQDTGRLPNVPPSVIQTEMEAVVLDGRIQSVSPTSLPLPRAGGSATTSVQPPSVTTPLLGLLALALAGLAIGAVVLLRHWMGARPVLQPERASGHLLHRLRPPQPPGASSRNALSRHSSIAEREPKISS